jgi:putative DNA primase/helicase
VVLPPEAREVLILADNDSSGAGLRAAETIARKLNAEGRKAAICQPPQADSDFNDLLMSDGPAAVADLVRAALVGLAERETEEPVMGRHLPFGFALPSPPLPNLRADEGDLSRAGDQAWSLLLASNRRPWLFRAGGVPSWIVPDDEGRPMAAALGEERLRYMLARLAHWRRIGRSNEFVPAAPPTGLVKSLLATPDPALPVLAGIVATPVFGRNGALLTEPGYHAEAKLLYHPEPGFRLPPIPAMPTEEDVAQAKALILDDLFGDFPFVSDSERAHAVALLLLGFVRAMIDGPTPLHLIEKPEAGTGAGLMIDIIAAIVTGRPVSVMTASDNDEEWRKRITAKLRQMPAMAVIDNINNEIDSAALPAALTAPFWEDRILGVSEIVRIPIRCVWIATGNNPQFSREIARRIVRIRLDAKRDRPWLRSGFRHPDLMGWVRANRPRLVRQAGGREEYRQLRSLVAHHGRHSRCRRHPRLPRQSRRPDGGKRCRGRDVAWLVTAWWDRFGTAEVGVSDVYEIAISCEPPLALGSGNDRSQRTRLGKALGKLRDRVFDLEGRSVRIATAGVLHKSQRWTLLLQEGSAPDPATRGDVGASPANVPTNVPIKKHAISTGLGTLGTLGMFSLPARMCARARARVKKKGAKNVPNVPNVPKRLQITWKIPGDVAGDIPAKPRNVPTCPTG